MTETTRPTIDEVFARCAAEKRSAFIPYLTAGDPDLETTALLIEAMAAGGADLIELGVPFSDPIADGPINQRAAYRALRSGTTLPGILRMVAGCREKVPVPIVLFTYFNPIHARGVRTFAEQAAQSGIDGVLCVDLPPEEAEESLLPALQEHQIDSIFLLAPTSDLKRIKTIGSASTGFVYYVSRTGVTGDLREIPEELAREVRLVRKRVRLPVAVGFGISTPEQVSAVSKVADGVVVGSALVKMVEEWSDRGGAGVEELALALERRVGELVEGLRRPARRSLFRR